MRKTYNAVKQDLFGYSQSLELVIMQIICKIDLTEHASQWVDTKVHSTFSWTSN